MRRIRVLLSSSYCRNKQSVKAKLKLISVPDNYKFDSLSLNWQA